MNLSENIHGRMIVHPDFYKTLNEIKSSHFKISQNPIFTGMEFDPTNYPNNESVLSKIENIEKKELNANNGLKLINRERIVAGYDESIELFPGLEGTANLTAHCLVIMGKFEYVPVTYITYYFYTRSKRYADGKEAIKFSSKIEEDMKKNYAVDRKNFLSETVPSGSILFIDGPLIGGNLNYITREMNNKLLEKNVTPIFFVKNSNSNLVSDNVPSLKGKFNSDLDWAHNTFKMGERSPFFMYVDKLNKDNGKIFCYIRTSDLTVQRVEFHIQTFQKYREEMENIMDLVLYMLYVQGDNKNPQVRTIAVSEKYARTVLRFINSSYIGTFSFTPTMNSIRFSR